MPTGKKNKRWQEILETIHSSIEDRGFPPTVREIGKAVGLSSSSTVAAHLVKLEDNGLVAKDPTKPRTLMLTQAGRDYIGVTNGGIPIVGTVAAGVPITAIQNIDDYFPVPDDIAMMPTNYSCCACLGTP